MKKIDVILLDDDADDRMLLEEALDPGYFNIVARCAGGQEMLTWLAGNSCPDMIIADFYLPGLNSLDIVRRMRLRCSNPSFAYVLLTGADIHNDALIQSNSHLFDELLEKPFDYQKLVTLNATLMEIARKKGILPQAVTGTQQSFTISAGKAERQPVSGNMHNAMFNDDNGAV